MKLSIITINYNNSEGLLKTLLSVAEQVPNDGFTWEHIIIDGASTDGSVEVIREYAERNANSDLPSTSRLSDSNCPVGNIHRTPYPLHYEPLRTI